MISNTAALKRIIEGHYTTGTFKLLLLQDAASLTPSDGLLQFLAKEVTVDGYARPSVVFAANTALDSSTGIVKFPEQSIVVIAGSNPIQFDGMALIKNPWPGGNSKIVAIAGDVLTPSAEPCNNGDTGFFTCTGTPPAGIQINTPYGIYGSINNSDNTFKLRNLDITNTQVTNIGDSWAGDLIWHPLVGTIELPFDLRPDNGQGDRTYTIQPNQNHLIKLKDFGIRVKP